jgi:catalase (peroxidase I)
VLPVMRATEGCHPTDNTTVLLQLPVDRALLLDSQFRDIVVAYANNETLFFEQYAKSVKKMSELGRDISVQWCDYNSTSDSSLTMDDDAKSQDTILEAVFSGLGLGGGRDLRTPE